MRISVLGAPVDLISKQESLSLLTSWIEKNAPMKLVVTAYSEFYVRAQYDLDFKRILNEADLVTPDGVSVLAATKYLNRINGKSRIEKLAEGIKIGGEILQGKVGETVTGVWLFENLTKMAGKQGWKIFLLGGWNNVSGRTAQMLLKRFPKIKVEYDEGETRVGTDEETNKRVVLKINKFAPDILFVSYNPINQEKWLALHKRKLKAKVGIGVGGTFNEYLGEFKKAPKWMEKAGLKWLWRVWIEPKRWKRIFKAVIVFPWMVFKESCH